ncbi:MAG: hypothetical protein ACIAQU_03950 [Phycisphaerales bacterium JB064]
MFFIIVGLVIGFVTALAPMGQARQEARQLKDSTQLRGITQASAIWAQNNQERYPTPSRVDRKGVTIPRPEGLNGRDLSLDTTGNILSAMIFNGFFPVELTVSPAEVGNVEVFANYQFANPTTTVNPPMALWDPAFRGTPLDVWGGKVPGIMGSASHNSYAQVAYYGRREHMWGNTFSASEAVWGNRGPAYTLEEQQWVPLRNSPFGDASTTMRIHGNPTTWEGNVAFNDQHVDFVTQPDPAALRWHFVDVGGQGPDILPDNLFHAEHDRTRAPIGEHLEVAAAGDARGIVRHSGKQVGDEALDQRNNYLRPISKVIPGENGAIEAHIWVD